MKRSPELRDLSEEHHYGLVAARSLRLAATGEGDIAGAVTSFLAEWAAAILPHFRTEEQVLLPEAATVLGAEHPLLVRTREEHIELERVVLELRHAIGPAQRVLAARAAQLLHDHIRFEERVLFPEIEAQLSGEVRMHLGAALKEAMSDRQAAGPRCGLLSRLSTEKPLSRM